MLGFSDPRSGVVKAVRKSCDAAAGIHSFVVCVLVSVCVEKAKRTVSH